MLFKFAVRIDIDEYWRLRDRFPLKGICSASRDVYSFFGK